MVDDDTSQIERYKDSIEAFSAFEKLRIDVAFENDLKGGLEALRRDDYDGAVVDLKLSGAGDAEGNQIIREIRRHKRFPVCVMTGYPNDLDSDLQEQLNDKPNLFFWLERRDRKLSDVLKQLVTIYNSGVIQIVGPDGVIEEALNKVFWTHLAKTLAHWTAQPESKQNRKERLLRFALTHLLHQLDVSDSGELDDYYPDEMYIIPALHPGWQTGDIVVRKSDSTNFILLTPACDLAQGKAKNLQVVEIESLDSGTMASLINECRSWKAKAGAKQATEEQKTHCEQQADQASATLCRLIGNGYSPRYHFLPPSQTFTGGLINFQKVQSYRFKEFDAEFSKAGTLAGNFVKDIVSRFASYYARQGQPSFETDGLLKQLLKESTEDKRG